MNTPDTRTNAIRIVKRTAVCLPLLLLTVLLLASCGNGSGDGKYYAAFVTKSGEKYETETAYEPDFRAFLEEVLSENEGANVELSVNSGWLYRSASVRFSFPETGEDPVTSAEWKLPYAWTGVTSGEVEENVWKLTKTGNGRLYGEGIAEETGVGLLLGVAGGLALLVGLLVIVFKFSERRSGL